MCRCTYTHDTASAWRSGANLQVTVLSLCLVGPGEFNSGHQDWPQALLPLSQFMFIDFTVCVAKRRKCI